MANGEFIKNCMESTGRILFKGVYVPVLYLLACIRLRFILT